VRVCLLGRSPYAAGIEPPFGSEAIRMKSWMKGAGTEEKVPSTLMVVARRNTSIPLSLAKTIIICPFCAPSTGPEYLNCLCYDACVVCWIILVSLLPQKRRSILKMRVNPRKWRLCEVGEGRG
jgi:hypothetical protein